MTSTVTSVVTRRTWSPRTHPVPAAGLLLAVAVVGAAVTVAALPMLNPAPRDQVTQIATTLAYVVPYALVGAVLVARRPDLPFGWLLSGCAAVVAVGLAIASQSYAALSRGADSPVLEYGCLLATVQFLPAAVQGLVNVRFPSGRVTSRFGRVLNWLLIAGIALGLTGGLLGDWSLELNRVDGTTATIHNPLTGGTAVGEVALALTAAIPLVILVGIVAGLRIVRQAWKATGVERDQLRWRAYGVVLSLALFPLAVTETLPLAVNLADGLLFTTTLVIPILRYRLWAIDNIIRRSAAYLLVTVLVTGIFAASAAGVTALQGERVGLVTAAVVAALVLGPALRRSQRLVDELFYGHRSDPSRALRDLSRQLDAVADPGEVLKTVVTAVADSLRLPYVAIERPRDGSVLAQHGDRKPADRDRDTDTETDAELGRWPLMSQGAPVGTLVAAPRRGESTLDARDRAVLADLARQAGAAVHAAALTADLVASRQRLVEAREEERRRLRRDLHDGLGPLLTSVGLNLDALRSRLTAGDGDPLVLLARAKEASSQAIADLRSVVYSLRPPALDDLGVVGAITAHVHRIEDGSTVDIEVEGDALPALPAAVEVALFRIAVEGVTNAVRHAGARTCRIRLDVTDGSAVVEVVDDGPSRVPWAHGVGTVAMRERVSELGGTLEMGPTGAGGRLRASFPLAEPPRTEASR
ncbi:sensor histidine kinase [Promicromonospora sp. NPDC057138]|uniref:sensor histidine kinase n=1 Tax=Promicromonospora sp. NPDC057138 TaxID=3346031 RepID=UPI003627F783